MLVIRSAVVFLIGLILIGCGGGGIGSINPYSSKSISISQPKNLITSFENSLNRAKSTASTSSRACSNYSRATC